MAGYDIVIAGAGPAGCAAAIRLRQARLRVAILDEVNDTALKVGESIPGAADRLLHVLGIPGLSNLLMPAEYMTCTANASAWGTDHWTYRDAIQNPEGGGWHVLRHRFDAALRRVAQARGVDFISAKLGKIESSNLEGYRYQIGFKKQRPNLPSALQCNWLIDASGRANVIGKLFGKARISYDDQLAIAAWLHPPTKDQDQCTRIKSVADGWWYSARLPGDLRVLAFHSQPEHIARSIKTPQQLITAVNAIDLLPYSISMDDFQQKPIARRAGIAQASSVAEDGWLAVGDAALSFDPLSSQGIFFALYSGLKGAEATLAALPSTNAEPFLQKYRQQVDAVFQANQRARAYHYTGELRYIDQPYWASRLRTTALV